jgi:hypothetical protein
MRPLFLVALALLLPTVATADLTFGPEYFIRETIKANGGTAAINKFRAEIAKIKGTMVKDGKEVPFTGQFIIQFPEQLKRDYYFEEDGKRTRLIRVLNGDKGWVSQDGTTRDYKKIEAAEDIETIHAYRMARLTQLVDDTEIDLTRLYFAGNNPNNVNGERAWGFRVQVKERRPVDLYLGANPQVLLKIERVVLEPDVKWEEYLSDYQEVNGVKRPMKRLIYLAGKKWLEMTVTEIKLSEQIDEKEFARP